MLFGILRFGYGNLFQSLYTHTRVYVGVHVCYDPMSVVRSSSRLKLSVCLRKVGGVLIYNKSIKPSL